MRKACVKAATAVNGSIRSDRDVRGMIRKSLRPRCDLQGCQCDARSVLHFIYEPFRKMTGRNYTKIIHISMPRTHGKRDYRINVTPSVEIELSLFLSVISLIT